MSETPVDQFFTWGALGTLAGATGATFVVTNALSLAFDFSPKWLGLAVAEAICLGTVAYIKRLLLDWPVAILNGCLVFLSAAGGTGAVNTAVNAARVALQPDVVFPTVAVILPPWT